MKPVIPVKTTHEKPNVTTSPSNESSTAVDAKAMIARAPSWQSKKSRNRVRRDMPESHSRANGWYSLEVLRPSRRSNPQRTQSCELIRGRRGGPRRRLGPRSRRGPGDAASRAFSHALSFAIRGTNKLAAMGTGGNSFRRRHRFLDNGGNRCPDRTDWRGGLFVDF